MGFLGGRERGECGKTFPLVAYLDHLEMGLIECTRNLLFERGDSGGLVRDHSCLGLDFKFLGFKLLSQARHFGNECAVGHHRCDVGVSIHGCRQ